MTPLNAPRIFFDRRVVLEDSDTDIIFPEGSIWKVVTGPEGISQKSPIELEEIRTGKRVELSHAHLFVLLFSGSDAVVLMTRSEAQRLMIRAIGSG